PLSSAPPRPSPTPERPPAILRQAQDTVKTGASQMPAHAPPRPSPAPEPSPLPQTGGIIDRRSATWEKIRQTARAVALSTKQPIDGWLNACRQAALEGDTLVLTFVVPGHRDKMEEPANRRALEEAIKNALGASYKVRCVLDTALRASSRGKTSGSQPPSPLVEEAKRLGAQPIEEE
ncbi:MAG: hypothetical protein Q8O76_00905, partial [Chloroflexota bacterium]|nr:hypothetical protein [Chloroflexota bacterium]